MKSYKEINQEMQDFLFGNHPVSQDIYGGIDIHQPAVITHAEFIGESPFGNGDGFDEYEEPEMDWGENG